MNSTETIASRSINPKELDQLADHEDWSVRLNVAANEKTSAETLEKLANDGDLDVRTNVAYNENTRETTLDKLAEDHHIMVRLNVAMNNNTSIQTLLKLSNSGEVDISHEAKKNLKNRDVLGELLGESKCFESFVEWKSASRVK